jgi:hypothetical protein
MRISSSALLLLIVLYPASWASAQLDREVGITLKRNLGPGGPADALIKGVDQLGVVPFILEGTMPEPDRNAQLADSYAFVIHGTMAGHPLAVQWGRRALRYRAVISALSSSTAPAR